MAHIVVSCAGGDHTGFAYRGMANNVRPCQLHALSAKSSDRRSRSGHGVCSPGATVLLPTVCVGAGSCIQHLDGENSIRGPAVGPTAGEGPIEGCHGAANSASTTRCRATA